jgi:hypothetical protein
MNGGNRRLRGRIHSKMLVENGNVRLYQETGLDQVSKANDVFF